MNILFLIHIEVNREQGGLERVTSVLADYFEAHGNNTYYISLIKSEIGQNNEIDIKRQFFLPNNKNDSIFLKNFIETHNINVIINQEGLRYYESKKLLSSIHGNVKIISIIHNSPLAILNSFGITFHGNLIVLKKILLFLNYRNCFISLIKNSDVILLLSDHYKRDFQFIAGKKCDGKLHSMYNPVSFPLANNEEDKDKILLYVGRVVNASKRIDLLLKIWENIYQYFPDWKLQIVGRGEDLDININLARKMRLENIFFNGYQNPILFYKQASIFCMTSAFEGFPMVLIEAMNFGVIPFAFGSFAAVTDIIDNGINGEIIPPFNIDVYTSRLKELMSDKERLHKMSNAAIQKAGEFCIDKIGDDWMTIINHLDIIHG